MAENFHIGDNVAVKYQSSVDEKYWILLCDTIATWEYINIVIIILCFQPIVKV
jgi:hypothetical protein